MPFVRGGCIRGRREGWDSCAVELGYGRLATAQTWLTLFLFLGYFVWVFHESHIDRINTQALLTKIHY